MIRILQVFTILNRGGAESMIMNYYRNIDRSKVQFDFLVHRPNEKGVFDEEIKKLGGEIYAVNPVNIVSPKKYFDELRVFFKEHTEYRIVHSHVNTFSYYVLKIAEEFNIPVRIAHAHIALPKVKIQDFLNKKNRVDTLKIIVKQRLKKKIHKHATHFFSCGKKAGEWLFGTNSSFEIINNAIDSSKFSYNDSIAKEYKKEYNLEGYLTIGHIGNFKEQKNHAFILDIFHEVQKMHPNSRLALVGGGDLRKDIEVKSQNLGIKDKVLFMGVRKDIAALCSMFDVFLFPSLYEGLPVTLIEAQAADLKIFAADTITKEVKFSSKLSYLSNNDAASIWASSIMESYPYHRKDTTHLIKEHKYDIKENARALQEFYFKNNTVNA